MRLPIFVPTFSMLWSTAHGRVFNLERVYFHGRGLPIAQVSLRYFTRALDGVVALRGSTPEEPPESPR